MDIEKQMQEEINRQREIHNRVLVRDPVTGRREYREGWRPGTRDTCRRRRSLLRSGSGTG